MVASIQDIPVEDAAFDIVISCETIEHVVDPLRALREVCRVLRPGGRLLLTTPNYLGPMGLYRAYLRAARPPLHRRRSADLPLHHVPAHAAVVLSRRADESGASMQRATICSGRDGRLARICIGSIRYRWLRWFALHSLVIAEKP